jgi:hypothetical protein
MLCVEGMHERGVHMLFCAVTCEWLGAIGVVVSSHLGSSHNISLRCKRLFHYTMCGTFRLIKRVA